MWKSTPTIYSVIEHAAILYRQVKSVAATHVFVSSYNYKKLATELSNSQRIFNYDTDHSNIQHIVAINVMTGNLKIIIVSEDSKDFILIGREDDYLDYVMERTVL